MKANDRGTVLFLALAVIMAFSSCEVLVIDSVDPMALLNNTGSSKRLINLAISSPPNKVVYELNESADWTGLKVTETYSDDSFRIETDYNNYTITGFDSSSPGIKALLSAKTA
jgi:hypothetical protein